MDYKSNQCAEKTVQLNGIIQSEKLENWKYILRFNSSPFPAVLLLLSFATLARSSLIHFHVIVLSRRNKGPSVNQSVSHRNILWWEEGRGWLVVKRAAADPSSHRVSLLSKIRIDFVNLQQNRDRRRVCHPSLTEAEEMPAASLARREIKAFM